MLDYITRVDTYMPVGKYLNYYIGREALSAIAELPSFHSQSIVISLSTQLSLPTAFGSHLAVNISHRANSTGKR